MPRPRGVARRHAGAKGPVCTIANPVMDPALESQ